MKPTSCFGLFVFTAPLALAASFEGPSAAPVNTTLAVSIIIFVDAVFLLSLFVISAALQRDAKWSLAAALAEAVDWQPTAPVIPGVAMPPMSPRIEPSASRLIAFVGMLAVVMVFLGFADCILWQAFTGQKAGLETSDMLKFLFAGAALFVPYAVNQLRSAFESFGTPTK